MAAHQEVFGQTNLYCKFLYSRYFVDAVNNEFSPLTFLPALICMNLVGAGMVFSISGEQLYWWFRWSEFSNLFVSRLPGSLWYEGFAFLSIFLIVKFPATLSIMSPHLSESPLQLIPGRNGYSWIFLVSASDVFKLGLSVLRQSGTQLPGQLFSWIRFYNARDVQNERFPSLRWNNYHYHFSEVSTHDRKLVKGDIETG
jgi:hypothetical protein